MPAASPYTGVDNLEVMEAAERYCRYLTSTVTSAAGAPDRGLRIVDFGAGTGTIALRLTALGYEVDCVEPDATLGQRLRSAGLETSTSIDTLPTDPPVDLVYSMNVLEHIEDDGATLRGLYDVVRSGGALLLYVPAMPVLYSAMDRKVGHHRRYLRRPLIELVSDAGFEVTRTAYVDSLGFVATMAYKVIGSKDGDLGTRSVALYDRFGFPASRALDRVTGRMFGKNLLLVARRP